MDEKPLRRDNQYHGAPRARTRRIDLNLLDVLHILVEEKSVSAAAARLGVTQPAVSNALARLRHQVGDPLLVRSASGMQPTARALELAAPVREALDAMSAAVEGARRFEPASYRGEFSVASVDYATEVFMPHFAQRLREWAPHARVRVARANGNARDTVKDAGAFHLVLSDANMPAGSLPGVPLLEDDWRVIVRRGHALAGGIPHAAALVRHRFVVSRIPDDDMRAQTDVALARLGLRRRIAVVAPSSAFTAGVVAATDHASMVCTRIAERAVREHDVVALASPVELAPLRVRMYWHRRHEASPLHRWLRERAAELARTL